MTNFNDNTQYQHVICEFVLNVYNNGQYPLFKYTATALLAYLFAEHSCSVGRVLDLESKDCWLKPHCRQSHCVVSLSKTLYPLLSTGSTHEDPSRHDRKIVDLDVKNQTKRTNLSSYCSTITPAIENLNTIAKCR